MSKAIPSQFTAATAISFDRLPHNGPTMPIHRIAHGGERLPGRVAQAAALPISSRSNLLEPSEIPYRHTALENYSSLYGTSGNLTNISDVIKKCQYAYVNYGLLRTYVDIMTEFAAEGVDITHPQQAGRVFFRAWKKAIKFKVFVKQFFLEMFRAENVPVYKIYGQVVRSRLKGLEEKRQKKPSSRPPKGTVRIPVEYVVLNPATIVSAPSLFGDHRPYGVKIPRPIVEAVKKSQARMKKGDTIFDKLSGPLIDAIRKGDNFINLEPEYFDLITRNRQPYESFAFPSLWSVLDPLTFKMELQTMDREAARTQIRTFGLINVGEKEEPASDPELESIQDLVEQSSSSTYLITNHTVKISYPAPEIDKILSSTKYEQVERDIRMSMGIHDSIFGGSSDSSYSNAFLSIRTLVQRIASARDIFLEYMQAEVDSISKAIGLQVPGRVTVKSVGLRDENVEKRIMIRLVETGVIPPEVAIHALNTGELPDFLEIKEAWKEHAKEIEEGRFLPLQAIMAKQRDEKVAEEKKKTGEDPKAPENPKIPPKGEKPPGATGPQQNPRDPAPKPKGMASANTLFKQAEEVVWESFERHVRKRLTPTERRVAIPTLRKMTRFLLATQDPKDLEELGHRALACLQDQEIFGWVEEAARKRFPTEEAFFAWFKQYAE